MIPVAPLTGRPAANVLRLPDAIWIRNFVKVKQFKMYMRSTKSN